MIWIAISQLLPFASMLNGCGDCLSSCENNAIKSILSDVIPILNQDKCASCGDCYEVCEDNSISRDLFTAEVNQEECHKCGKCEDACPEHAIKKENNGILS